jgi:hypothetical protein
MVVAVGVMVVPRVVAAVIMVVEVVRVGMAGQADAVLTGEILIIRLVAFVAGVAEVPSFPVEGA